MKWPRLPWQRKSGEMSSLELFRQIMGAGRSSRAGEGVDLTAALRCAAVFACARVIATGIAQVPLKLYRETGGDRKEPAKDHPLYQVLHRKPNPWQTSYELRETIGLHLVLAGRAYCYKTIVNGAVRELIPFEPGRVRAELADDGIAVRYFVRGKDGLEREFDAGLIWHIKSTSWSGWEALDALDIAREAVGLAIAAEGSQSALHKNGIKASGVYSVEGSLNEKQYRDLRKFLADNHADDGLPMIVDRAAKWLPMAMTGVDAQHLETRQFQVAEICRAMGVMPIMVFANDKTQAFASVEAMYDAHVVHTMAAYWERLEQSIDCNVLTSRDRTAGVYAKFIGSALARGSLEARGNYYSKALGAGGGPAWMTQDEIRSLEELNPMGGVAAALPVATNLPAGKQPA